MPGISMSNSSKYMVFGSIGVAVVVAILAILDMPTGIPFNQQIVMDIMFLIGAGLVIFMGWDAYQDLK